MSTRDLALSAAVSREATKDPIKNMSRAQAIQYCLDNKLPMALAVGVGDNVALQKQKAQMMAMQQPSKPPVLEANHQQAVQQYTADQARQGGIADLPVDPSLYSFSKPGMKAGGIVAFTPDQPGNQGQLVNADSSGAVRSYPMAGTDTDLATYVRSYMGEDTFDRLNPVDKSNVLKSLAPKYNEQHQAAMIRANAQPLLDASKNATQPMAAAPAPAAPKPPTVAAPAPAAPTPVKPPAAPAAAAPTPVKPPAAAPVATPAAAAPAAPAAPATPKPTTKRGALTDVAHTIAPDHAGMALDTSESAQFTIPKDAPPWMTSLYNDHQRLSSDLGKKAEAYDPGKIEDFVTKMSDLSNPRNKDTKEFLENLSTQSADALKRKDKAKWMALINFGHGVANANPHAGLLAAITTGGSEAGGQYMKDLADVRAAQNEVVKNRYMAQQHLQDGAIGAYEKQAAKFEMANDRKYQADTKFQDTMGQILGTMAHAKITAQAHPYYEPIDSQIWRELGQKHPDWTTEQKVAAMPKGFVATTSSGARVSATEITAAASALKNLTGGSDIRQFPNAPGHDQWQQEVDHWTSIAQSGGGASAAPPSPQYQEGQTATNPSTGKAMIFHNGQWVAK